MTIMNLETPKAGAKHELLFNEPSSEAGLLNKSSCSAAALGVTKFIDVKDMILVTLYCATNVGLKCSKNPPLLPKPNCKNKSFEIFDENYCRASIIITDYTHVVLNCKIKNINKFNYMRSIHIGLF
jgi:hypothetical protein